MDGKEGPKLGESKERIYHVLEICLGLSQAGTLFLFFFCVFFLLGDLLVQTKTFIFRGWNHGKGLGWRQDHVLDVHSKAA